MLTQNKDKIIFHLVLVRIQLNFGISSKNGFEEQFRILKQILH